MNAETANFHRKQYMAYVAGMDKIWQENAMKKHDREQKEIIQKGEKELKRIEKELQKAAKELLKTEAELLKTETELQKAEKKLLLTAKNMLTKGIDIQTIIECTGLDIEIIKSL